MSNGVKDFKVEIEERIKTHNPNFQPTVTYKQSVLDSGEKVVNYYVYLSKENRSEYVKNYFNGDRAWVESKGVNDYDITSTLYCEWQT